MATMKVLHKADPTVAYMGPEKGPFKCGHCEYFESPSSCRKVDGAIDPNGCCNLYQMNNKGGSLHALKQAGV